MYTERFVQSFDSPTLSPQKVTFKIIRISTITSCVHFLIKNFYNLEDKQVIKDRQALNHLTSNYFSVEIEIVLNTERFSQYRLRVTSV